MWNHYVGYIKQGIRIWIVNCKFVNSYIFVCYNKVVKVLLVIKNWWLTWNHFGPYTVDVAIFIQKNHSIKLCRHRDFQFLLDCIKLTRMHFDVLRIAFLLCHKGIYIHNAWNKIYSRPLPLASRSRNVSRSLLKFGKF